MSKMCHACESEEAIMDEVHNGLVCSDSCCEKCGHSEKSSVINGEMDWLSMDTSPSSTPYGTPLFSRESSFSSFASCFSSLGDSLGDTDSEEENELLDTGQLHPDILFSDEFMEQGKGNLVQVEECQLSHSAVVDDGASFPIPSGQNILSGQLQLEIDHDATKENSDSYNIILDANVSYDPHQDILSNDQFTEMQYHESVEDIEIKQSDLIDVEEVTSLSMPGGEIIPLNEQVMDQLDSTKENTIIYNNILNTEPDMKSGADFENGSDYLYPLVLPSFDTDPLIWLPPEPANEEDDIDIVANNDDDSDNNDTRWGHSSFNISIDGERSKDSREYQLQKAMSDVMNGQFKILVSRFLAAEGFSLSDGGTDKSWLDTVASLSWDAALLVKPDANVGNAMDPGLYVKVKCIASGYWQQSEVIKGLVFKKSAAHKQMRANIKHPKLLLLLGALGHASTGLSSMNSMKQILLKGSTSKELKKIKRVLHFTVFAAYHLILETSFFADQRLFITEKNVTGKENWLKTDQQLLVPSSATSHSKFCSDSSKNSGPMKRDLNIPTSDEQYANMEGFVNTENSTGSYLHDSKIKTFRDPADGRFNAVKGIQSYSSLPVLDPSANLIGDILSSDCADPTSCDDFDGSDFTATSKNVNMQKKEPSGENCQETVDEGMCSE